MLKFAVIRITPQVKIAGSTEKVAISVTHRTIPLGTVYYSVQRYLGTAVSIDQYSTKKQVENNITQPTNALCVQSKSNPLVELFLKMSDLTPEEEEAKRKKRQERLEQNRISARESRKRKKTMIEELQKTVINLSRENKGLNERNETLRRQLLEVGSKVRTTMTIRANITTSIYMSSSCCSMANVKMIMRDTN